MEKVELTLTKERAAAVRNMLVEDYGLEIDSLDEIELIMKIEQIFGVHIPDRSW